MRRARRATRPPPAPPGGGAFSPSEVQYVAVLCGERALARRVAALCNAFYSSPTVREHPVGRGFEEVHERERHKLKSAPHKRRAKTPLRRTKKGSTLFALPSMGSNPFCLGSFGGARGGLFQKSPRINPHPSRLPYCAASTIAVNFSGTREAPPIRPPSTLGLARSSAAFFSFIEPPY